MLFFVKACEVTYDSSHMSYKVKFFFIFFGFHDCAVIYASPEICRINLSLLLQAFLFVVATVLMCQLIFMKYFLMYIAKSLLSSKMGATY